MEKRQVGGFGAPSNQEPQAKDTAARAGKTQSLGAKQVGSELRLVVSPVSHRERGVIRGRPGRPVQPPRLQPFGILGFQLLLQALGPDVFPD